MARLLLVQSLFVEQFGIMTLSAVAKAAGHQVAFAIGSDRHILEKAQKFKPDVVGFSVLTGYQDKYLNLGKQMKRIIDPSPLILFGGPHPTFFPKVVLEDGVDAICVGEGEGAITELLEAVDRGDDISGIRNLGFEKDGELVCNPMRPLVDLDTVPFPDREIYAEYPVIHESNMVTFMASRGCPYHCSFCFNRKMVGMVRGLGQWVRFRSVDNFMQEIAQVHARHKINFIDFHDDTFILKKDWLFPFLEAYRREFAIPFSCQIRADLLTPEIAKALKDAGCQRVSFGLESGNEELRNLVLKKNLSNKSIKKAAEILRETGIEFFTTNMMGLPGETLEDAFKTLELNIEIGTRCAWTSLFQPFPGTDLAKYCLDNGYLEKPISTGKPVDTHTTSQLSQPDIDKVVRLQKFAYVVLRFPSLLPLVKKLINYDFPTLYFYIHRISYLLLYFRAAYQTTWKETIKHAWIALRHY